MLLKIYFMSTKQNNYYFNYIIKNGRWEREREREQERDLWINQ